MEEGSSNTGSFDDEFFEDSQVWQDNELNDGDVELVSGEKQHAVTNVSQIVANITAYGDLNVSVDALNFDVTEEAAEKAKYSLYRWLEDFCINLFYPFSCFYVYFVYGYEGLQLRSMAAPTPEPDLDEKESHKFYDPEKPVYQLPSFAFFILTVVIGCIRTIWFVTFIMSRTYVTEEGDGKARAPLYHFVMSVVIYGLFLMSISNKKAFRKKSSEKRLRIHKERRNEEIFFGWLPLPKGLALFELRLAACKCGSDIKQKYLTFDTSSELSVRRSIGDTILQYLERDGKGIVAVKPNEDWTLNEKEEMVKVIRPGCKLNMTAFLLRIALDKSYADPAFGEKAMDTYINARGSKWWSRYVFCLQLLPYIVDYGVRGGGSYNDWAIASCVMSFLMVFSSGDGPPQGFTYSSILTIARKKDMLSFLNDLIYSDKQIEEEHETVSDVIHDLGASYHKEWRHRMDLTSPENIENWRKMRDIVMAFGQSYKARTDANGAIMMLYVAVFTLALLLGTVLLPERLDWHNYAFYVIFHISLVIPMGIFAAVLAMQGDACNDVSDKSKMALTAAMIRLEVRAEKGQLTEEQMSRLGSARFATTQLHESLTSSSRLYPTQILGIIDLDRTLVLSVIFAIVTQITLIIENINI